MSSDSATRTCLEMHAWAENLEDPLIPLDGLPFATIPGSSDLLVMFDENGDQSYPVAFKSSSGDAPSS